ncbi:hypothetical protein MMC30_002918 [Trapelia coarctata]|nr:hypothetical protein [Trapelia coarctata]
MPQLEELVLAIPEEGHLDVFEKQFKEANLILPDVHTLVLSRACEFVVQLCPNVRRISSKESKGRQPDRTKHSIMLLEAAAKATKLTRFGMVEAWDVAFTEVLLSTLPHVRWLDLEPSLGGCDPILKLIPVLSRFPNLQHLGLADAILLGVGFNPPWCGNAYDGPDGAKVLEWVLKEQVEVEELVAKTAGAACSRLLDEWIGRRTLLSIVRDAKGNCVDVVRQAFDEPQKAIGIFWRFHP